LFQAGMNVRKEDSPADPAYPDAKEFLKNRASLGVAIFGAGVALGGCADTGRTGGVPIRTGGVVAVPEGSSEKWAGDPKTWKGADRNRLDGVAVSGSKTEPSHPMGKFKIEPKPDPPPLPGSPPVVPSNPEH
jgi:hypothetical protein